MLGPYDYAHIPASSVPELSLVGDKPFTLFTSLCFKNVQGGAIFTQNDVSRPGNESSDLTPLTAKTPARIADAGSN